MVHLGFGSLRRRMALAHRAPVQPDAERLSNLLPEGVAAILHPHLKAALDSYAERHHEDLLVAYAAGALLLSDLLAQNKRIEGWREAAETALARLARRSEVEAFAAPRAVRRAMLAADDLLQEMTVNREHLAVCQMLNGAISDMSDSRTASRGAVALRAGMARIEAAALRARPGRPLAA